MKELGQGIDHLIDLIVPHLRKHGEAQQLASCLLRYGEGSRSRSKMTIGVLKMLG